MSKIVNRTKTTVYKVSLARIDQDTVREGSALSRTRLEAYKNIHRGVSQDRGYFRFGGVCRSCLSRPEGLWQRRRLNVSKWLNLVRNKHHEGNGWQIGVHMCATNRFALVELARRAQKD